MSTIKVIAALHSLFCFHGADEEESEPYLWTIMFTLGGGTIRQAGDRLGGGPGFFFGPGSHGNLHGSIGTGVTKHIPPEVGRFETTLEPIVLSIAGQTVEVPGQLGMIAVLVEENSTSDSGAEAAHQALNALVREEFREALEEISLAGVAAEAQGAIRAGTPPQQAAAAVMAEKMQRVSRRIQRFAKDVVVATVVEHLHGPGALIQGLDPDKLMGVVTHVFDEGTLRGFEDRHREALTDPINGDEFAYNLHGTVWRPIARFFTPLTEDVPAGRWQVTGIHREGRADRTFISHIGGHFQDNSPWVLRSSHAMNLIEARTHSFFVHGSSGVDADLIVEQNDRNPLFPFLTTVADDDPTNNLVTLPPCPLEEEHEREVA